MIEDNRRKFYFVEYFSERWKVMLTFLLVNMIYFIVYLLYHVPIEAFTYGLELSAFLGLILMIYDYRKFSRKHIELEKLVHSIEVNDLDARKAQGCIERDYQLLIERLRQQLMKAVQEADEKRTNQMDYLTMWTHQIKTPVSALHLLVSSKEYSAEKSALEQELFRVEEYIGMVLQYLRIDTMSSDLLLKEYDLYTLVKQSVKKYSIIFIHKHLSLELDEFKCVVVSDEKWLSFVVEQVLSNALKYTKEGCIRIYVEEEKVLVIEDTGIGIRVEDLNRVFERGYTGYNGRLDKKSTGIGMYLCKNILDKLGHKISIESTPGVGTKVKIHLKEYHLNTRD